MEPMAIMAMSRVFESILSGCVTELARKDRCEDEGEDGERKEWC